MLSSIHPLGERARHNRWTITATAFVVGAALAGATVGGLLGLVGSFLPGGPWRLFASVAIVVAAGAADLAGVAPPGPKRQVNEDWIGSFRGWVYGGAFGAQLGAGVSTFVVTWGVWAVGALSLLSGGWRTGALIGLVFGLSRSVFPLAAGWIDRPSRLTAFNRAMAQAAGPVARTAAIAFIVVGVLVGLWGAV